MSGKEGREPELAGRETQPLSLISPASSLLAVSILGAVLLLMLLLFVSVQV